TATCSFTVTVTQPTPRLSVTHLMAFGDSITEGKTATGSIRPTAVGCPQLYENPIGYVARLRSALTARYTAQTIDLLNCGYGGETVLGPAGGEVRLPGALAQYTPQLVLLLQGANDLIAPGANPDAIVTGLRDMVQTTRRSGAAVLIGTLLPQRPSGSPPRATDISAALVPLTNDRIRVMAAAEGAILVDLYQAFGGVPDPLLIDSDGLHPTAQGHQRVADTFFTTLRTRFETPRPTTATLSWR